MMTMKLEKSVFGGYAYLSKEDSELYDKVKDSADSKDQTIKRLIEEKAAQCYAAHQRSPY